MGRGKHCTPERRALIQKLISEGKTYKEVENLLDCSSKMICNAIKFIPRLETRGRPRIMSKNLVRSVVKYSKQHPFASYRELKDELNVKASARTVQRYLATRNRIKVINTAESEDEDAIDQVFDELNNDIMVVTSCRRGIENPIPEPSESHENVENDFIISDEMCRQMLKIDKAKFTRLVDLIRDDTEFQTINAVRQFSVEFQFAVVLYRLMSSGENASVKKIAKTFGFGDGGTLTNFTNRVFRAFLKLQSKYVFWPNQEKRNHIVEATFNEMPWCIGYLDSLDVNFAEPPIANQATYFSKNNNNFSIKAQIVCDHKLRIRNVVVGNPGSVNKVDIYRNCLLSKQREKFFSSEQWLAADSTYSSITHNVVTPYECNTNFQDNEKRLAFNFKFNQYQVRIKQCQELLMHRFSSLKEIRMRIRNQENHQFCCEWIIVCCILHNILLNDLETNEFLSSFVSEEKKVAEVDFNDNSLSKHQDIKRHGLYDLMFKQSTKN